MYDSDHFGIIKSIILLPKQFLKIFFRSRVEQISLFFFLSVYFLFGLDFCS